jgi:pyruvate dehydrogenase E1 component
LNSGGTPQVLSSTPRTDGFGRSDYRRTLRQHFEVDRHYVVLAALSVLAAEEAVPPKMAAEAISRYDIDPEKPNPLLA